MRSLRRASKPRSTYHRPLRIEPLEQRTLLSARRCADQPSVNFDHALIDPLAQPSYIASNTLEMSPLTQGVASPPSGAYTPQQIKSVYGIDSISVGSLVGDGTGQTIAIVAIYDNPELVSSTDTNFPNSDLHNFSAQFGLPDPPSFRKLDQNGHANYPGLDPAGPGADKSWEAEEDLDIEWVHAIAPQANIDLIEANSPSGSDVLTAINTARNLPGVSVVVMSFGWTEAQISSAIEQSMDSLFTTPTGHQGITFVAATGDDGSPGHYPAYSPNVLAVGGTSQQIYSYDQSAWSGSGGGQSTFEKEPGYQHAVQNSGFRQIPDVAFDADPGTGAAVYDSYDFGASTPWVMLGGTSLAAPCWGSLVAIADQLRASRKLGSLDGRSQTLPVLYGLFPNDFYDITNGSNGGFSAGAGYDEVTGLGTPFAGQTILDLAFFDVLPNVVETTPSIAGGTLPAGTEQILVKFNKTVSSNGTTDFELHSPGPDGMLGTADDNVIPLQVYSDGWGIDGIIMQLDFQPLAENTYRLIAHDTITDTYGNKLDGNNDGIPGGDWYADFVVIPTGSVLNFSPSMTGRIGTDRGPDGIAIADFNGDGNPDLAVPNQSSNTVSVYLGDGEGALPLSRARLRDKLRRNVALGHRYRRF